MVWYVCAERMIHDCNALNGVLIKNMLEVYNAADHKACPVNDPAVGCQYEYDQHYPCTIDQRVQAPPIELLDEFQQHLPSQFDEGTGMTD
jgi:hypothetical protein